MKSTFKKIKYSCPNCSTVQEHYIWSDQIKTTTHLCDHGGCGTILLFKDIIVKKLKQLVSIRTPTKNR